MRAERGEEEEEEEEEEERELSVKSSPDQTGASQPP